MAFVRFVGARSVAPWRIRWRVAPLAISLFAACIVDEDDRCSPGQQLDDGLCRCPLGAMLVGNACVMVAMDAGSDASAPEADSHVSEAGGGGLGVGCGPSRSCTDGKFNHCQQAPSGERYCTNTGCSSASDCSGGYVCNTSASPSYCRRPYVGQEVPCTSAAMCSGDARFCSGILRVCLVQDCTADPSCDPGYTCFKASDFMPGAPNVCVKSERLQP